MPVVHLKRDPFDVRIDRSTAWGNPFAIDLNATRDEVITKYQQWVTTSNSLSAAWIRDHVHELQGKTLGCWCAPQGGVTADDLPWVCHGQVLLDLAAQAVYDGGTDLKETK